MWEKMGTNGIKNRFRGSFVQKMDDRGRIKLPSQYLSILIENYGNELYITSLNGDQVFLYPLAKWEEIEKSIERMSVRSPEIEEFLTRTGFWGNEAEVDARGRVLIPPELRKESQLFDDVRIFGKIDYMVAWNEGMVRHKALQGMFTDEKMQQVSRLLNEYSALSGNE